MENSNSLFPSFEDIVPDNPFLDYSEFKTRSSSDAAYLLNGKVVSYTEEEIAALIASGEFDKKSSFIYHDKNKNYVFDEGDIELYPVIYYYGKDAVKLEKIYNSVQPEPNEILIFIEDQTYDIYSSKKMFIKLGTERRKDFQQRQGSTEVFERAIKDRGFGTKTDGIYIANLIQTQAGKIENETQLNIVIKLLLAEYAKKAQEAMEYVQDLPIQLFDNIIGGLQELQFTSTDWNPKTATLKHRFTPYFFPVLQYDSKERAYLKGKGKAIPLDTLLNNLDEVVNARFTNINASFDLKYAAFKKGMETISFGLIEAELGEHSPLYGFINDVKGFVKGIIRWMADVAVEGMLFYNALLCGLINSLIEIVIGVFQLINLIFKLNKYSTKMLSKMSDWTEYMDNLLQTLVKLDLSKIAVEISLFFNQVISRLASAAWKYIKNISTAEIGYFIGYVLGFIIEQLIGAAAFGSTNVASAFRKSMKIFEAIIDIITGIFKKAALKTGKNILESMANFTNFLAKGTDEVLKFLKELWDAFLDWLDELMGVPKLIILRYSKRYEPGDLSPLVSLNKANQLHGNGGVRVVNAVDHRVRFILKTTKKSLHKKYVMVSGMVYKKGGNISKTFVNRNFTDIEIGMFDTKTGKYLNQEGNFSDFQVFLDQMHPTLKKRFEEHLEQIKKGLKADSNSIQRAAVPASHGEIRSLDKLLKEIDPKGKLGDKVFKNILGYNRIIRKEAVMHTCVHCFYLTDGITFIKL